MTQNFETNESKWARLKRRSIEIVKGTCIEMGGRPRHGVHVFYGYNTIPDETDITKGGIVKFQRLSKVFPNAPRRFNILYMVSSNYPAHAQIILQSSRRKGSKFVWNQNGVAYPAWMPSGWETANIRMAEFLHDADYVFYQSEFAQECSDSFLGRRTGPSEVLYNSVDTTKFCPAADKSLSNKPTLLVVGSQYHNYPLESAIKALECIKKVLPETHIVVAGKVHDRVLEFAEHLIADLNLKDSIRFLPPFTQTEAIEIYRKADILLHTKIQDVCPGVVIEAMACGVPVVYSISGGVPELVGKESGIGIPTQATWEKRIPPTPEAWTEAVLKVVDKYRYYSEAARQRAVEHFDLHPWIERHRQVFEKIVDTK